MDNILALLKMVGEGRHSMTVFVGSSGKCSYGCTLFEDESGASEHWGEGATATEAYLNAMGSLLNQCVGGPLMTDGVEFKKVTADSEG